MWEIFYPARNTSRHKENQVIKRWSNKYDRGNYQWFHYLFYLSLGVHCLFDLLKFTLISFQYYSFYFLHFCLKIVYPFCCCWNLRTKSSILIHFYLKIKLQLISTRKKTSKIQMICLSQCSRSFYILQQKIIQQFPSDPHLHGVNYTWIRV